MEVIKQFASTAEASNDSIVGVLGIDWMMLVFQIVAFLLLVGLLGKFVYPLLLQSVDNRQKRIEDMNQATLEAEEKALNAEKWVSKIISKARSEASEIVAEAKAESAATLNATEEKSKKIAEQIAISAEQQIKKEILVAKNALHNEMLDLVALATEKVVGKIVSKNIDNELIADAVKEVK